MLLMLVKSPLIHLLQAVVNMLLDKVLMQCHYVTVDSSYVLNGSSRDL